MTGITAAVLGSPIAHSLSPVLHTAGYRALGIAEASSYGRFEVTEDQLAAFLAEHPEHTGFSLTMPLKTELVGLAADRSWHSDETAAQTGAANTLIRYPDGQRIANTDVIGIVEAIAECQPAATDTAAILGSGATAASAVAALHRLGVAALDLYARRPERARGAADFASRLGMQAAIHPLADYQPGQCPLTVSTLPAGALSPESFSWPDSVDAATVLLDVAYAAGGYSVGADIAAHGGQAIAGERMLIHQAVEQQLLFAAAAGFDAPPQTWRPRLAAAMTEALRTAHTAKGDRR
ncbi:shikimate dehydrogenase family protein [Brevibacterium luteolum]|uniref:Shikimate dehydrogenase n=1 Tax=Brevibacterium luteolum TaxID=199591 RepID=A0A2N6PKZ8_9MICO|nr:shikimate dehydrogenase [Brevibacterium luteolum]PMB99351.1 shikimate dehydrogenase [Brevibacterium luteolum]